MHNQRNHVVNEIDLDNSEILEAVQRIKTYRASVIGDQSNAIFEAYNYR